MKVAVHGADETGDLEPLNRFQDTTRVFEGLAVDGRGASPGKYVRQWIGEQSLGSFT
jgi:hypothetical protein